MGGQCLKGESSVEGWLGLKSSHLDVVGFHLGIEIFHIGYVVLDDAHGKRGLT